MTPLFYEQSSSRALPDRTEGEGRGGPPSSTRYRHQIPSPSNILDSRILLIGRIGEENRRDDVSEEEEEKKKGLVSVIGIGNPLVSRRRRSRKSKRNGFLRVGNVKRCRKNVEPRFSRKLVNSHYSHPLLVAPFHNSFPVVSSQEFHFSFHVTYALLEGRRGEERERERGRVAYR